MADPNRKINLDLPSDDDDDDDSSDEPELDPSEISLVKEFEEEFKGRFTDEDSVFTEFCKQKPKLPPIVFPFEAFHHHHRGGGHHRGGHRGGRFHNYGQRQNYDNRRNNYDGGRFHHNRDNRHRDHHQNQPPFKRARDEPNKSGDRGDGGGGN